MSDRHSFVRTLHTRDAVLLTMTNILGAGIFLTQPEVARTLPAPFWFIVAWLAGGVIATCGALTSAELGVRMPLAGGDYVFLRKAYGPGVSFLYGYLAFFASFTGSIAATATGVIRFQGRSLWGDHFAGDLAHLPFVGGISGEMLLAIGIIVLLTALNQFGIRESLRVQHIVTVLPLLAIGAAGVWLLMDAPAATWQANWSMPVSLPGTGDLAMSMIPVYFAYAGWNAMLFFGEDIANPDRTIPRALIIGVLSTTAIYLLVGLTLLYAIPYVDLHGDATLDVATRITVSLLGPASSTIAALIIAFVVLSNLNGGLLAGTRIYVAMARDRIFFKNVARLDKRTKVPVTAMWAQAIWSVLLVLFLKDFGLLLQVTTIVILFMSLLSVGSVFWWRWTHPGSDVSFRTTGYPWIPLIYLVSTSAVIVALAVDERARLVTWAVLALVALAAVLPYLWRRIAGASKSKVMVGFIRRKVRPPVA